MEHGRNLTLTIIICVALALVRSLILKYLVSSMMSLLSTISHGKVTGFEKWALVMQQIVLNC